MYFLKAFLFGLSTFVCCLFAHAQQKNYVYCQLLGTGKIFSTQVTVQADFGQKTSFWKGVDYMRDEKGKKIIFNSMVDAMNYMGLQGWEFVQAYVVTVNSWWSKQNVYHWLLKKEISVDQINELEESYKVDVIQEDIAKGETVKEIVAKEDIESATLTGKWINKNGDFEITFTNNVGVFSQFNSGKWLNLSKKGKIGIDSQKFKNILKIGELTWKCKELFRDVSFFWDDSVLTLNKAGNILTVSSSGEIYTLLKVK
jgi:hypothetical protein